MSGAVKSVGKSIGKLFGGGGSAAPAQSSGAAQAETQVARSASQDEKAIALRRRRGSRALLSQERMEAEAVAGLGGSQTTLGA